jgi:hypothetical protein
MVETVDDEGKPLDTPPAPAGSALGPALALLGITAARAAGWLTLNDPLTRALLFVPLFTLLVVRIHRNTLQGAKGFTAMLGHPLLTYLVRGGLCLFVCISMRMWCLHLELLRRVGRPRGEACRDLCCRQHDIWS